jgi:hypothetical protein
MSVSVSLIIPTLNAGGEIGALVEAMHLMVSPRIAELGILVRLTVICRIR